MQFFFLRAEIEKTLPDDIPHVFISAVTGMGLDQLKDVLWGAITDEKNQIATPNITHRPLDGHHRVREEDEFVFDTPPTVEEPDYYDEGDDFDCDFDEGDQTPGYYSTDNIDEDGDTRKS